MTEALTAVTEDEIAWLRAFERRKGRPLRVLHIGNIANNAFLNAKFLRSAGIDAQVLSYDYSHVMATPEWEEVDLQHPHGNDFEPVFSELDLGGYTRPPWFVNGPLLACVSQMDSTHGRKAFAFISHLWQRLFALIPGGTARRAVKAASLLVADPNLLIYTALTIFARYSIARKLLRGPGRGLRAAFEHRISSRMARKLNIERHIKAFDQLFPDRRDRLRVERILPFLSTTSVLKKVFREFDIIQCYATEPIHALLSGKRPYVAYEHGTLRDFTMGDSPLHRLTALAYRCADHTFITNGDCLAYAERLGIENYSPMIHPIDVAQHRQDFGNAIHKLRTEIDAEVVLFCPLRHDWQVKGTDVHLRALPLIKERLERRVRLILIRWGQQLSDSEALIASQGCSNDVVWRSSMCRITMIKHIQAADVVLDQMALPHFGATAPQAIAAGTPVISSYDLESTRWIIPEPAPILPAFSPAEVADAVVTALDPAWRESYRRRAQSWTDTYHHPNNVIRDHLKVYRDIVQNER